MDTEVFPLVLEAMTLRGLGSYLEGARLEIRPLTILCGTNGSGKSTWFRMLRTLQESARRGLLPFGLDSDLWHDEVRTHDHTNPLVRPWAGYGQFLTSAAADRDFGPLGTIGLELRTSAAFDLEPARDEYSGPTGLLIPGSLPHSFLARGHCPKGAAFRVRITDPTYAPGIHITDSPLERMVELVVDHTYAIRFERRHPSPVRHFTATCTRAFWPGCDEEKRAEMTVAEFDVDDGQPGDFRSPSGHEPSDLEEWFCRTAIARIRQLLAKALFGVRWIGAIRSIERRASVEEKVYRDPDVAANRYVGGEGEYAQALARMFAYNEMRWVGPVTEAVIDYEFSSAEPGVREKLLAASDSTTPSPARRIWESASEHTRRAISQVEPPEGADDDGRTARALQEATVQVLNDALKRRDLFDPEYWPDDDDGRAAFLSGWGRSLRRMMSSWHALREAVRQVQGDYPDDLAGERAFWQGLVSRLPANEISAMNRLLIESVFPNLLRPHPGFAFITYYSVWLTRLLGIRLDDDGDFPAEDWCGKEPPCGFLFDYAPDEQRRREFGVSGTFDVDSSGHEEWIPDETFEDQRSLNRLLSPPLVYLPAAPALMSSGFHQVSPIIIQAGLMMANEILCIENPEVHLHPKLQLEMAEFLVREAAIGKYMIVETHCDLVVRRVMRAVLEEELKQEALRLYFTRMDTKPELHRGRSVAFSVLEPIEIDERGQIKNWPAGFMDEDIRESRRLLDIMYGNPLDATEEDEEATP
jgi:hypothetical protein